MPKMKNNKKKTHTSKIMLGVEYTLFGNEMNFDTIDILCNHISHKTQFEGKKTNRRNALSPLFIKTFTVQLCQWPVYLEMTSSIINSCIPEADSIRIFTIQFEIVIWNFLLN